MKPVTVSLLLFMVPFPGVAAAQSLDRPSASNRIEVRVETLANREGGPVDSCEVVQDRSAGASVSFSSWSTLGEAGSSTAAPSGFSTHATMDFASVIVVV